MGLHKFVLYRSNKAIRVHKLTYTKLCSSSATPTHHIFALISQVEQTIDKFANENDHYTFDVNTNSKPNLTVQTSCDETENWFLESGVMTDDKTQFLQSMSTVEGASGTRKTRNVDWLQQLGKWTRPPKQLFESNCQFQCNHDYFAISFVRHLWIANHFN